MAGDEKIKNQVDWLSGLLGGDAVKSISLLLLTGFGLMISACSFGPMAVRASLPIMHGGLAAMNRETDLTLAATAIPASLKMLEGMIEIDAKNPMLLTQAAQGFYAYAYGFVEEEGGARASALYLRGLGYAGRALQLTGLEVDLMLSRQQDLERAVDQLGKDAVPALFWSASCLARWVYLNRSDPQALAHIGRAKALMQRVLQLDDRYYYGGAHLFFGVYYGSLSPMFGGDYARSRRHFNYASDITQGKLLMVDVLYAESLARQTLDRKAFHEKLTAVVQAPIDLFPEMALANRIAQDRARHLLNKEKEWF